MGPRPSGDSPRGHTLLRTHLFCLSSRGVACIITFQIVPQRASHTLVCELCTLANTNFDSDWKRAHAIRTTHKHFDTTRGQQTSGLGTFTRGTRKNRTITTPRWACVSRVLTMRSERPWRVCVNCGLAWETVPTLPLWECVRRVNPHVPTPAGPWTHRQRTHWQRNRDGGGGAGNPSSPAQGRRCESPTPRPQTPQRPTGAIASSAGQATDPCSVWSPRAHRPCRTPCAGGSVSVWTAGRPWVWVWVWVWPRVKTV